MFIYFYLIFNIKDKKCSIVINNIVIISEKRIGGNYGTLLGDFALESSENFNSIFLKINSADWPSSSVIVGLIPTSHILFLR